MLKPIKHTLICLALIISSQAMASEDFKLNLQDANVEDLANTVAKALNKNLLLDPRVKGKVSFVTHKPMNKDALYEVFTAIMAGQGFAVSIEKDLIKVLPEANIKFTGMEATKITPSTYQTLVYSLKNIQATQVVPVLRPLVSPQGQLAGFQGSNSLLISDTQANIQRIQDIIKRMDVITSGDFEVVEIKHASALELAKILIKIYGEDRFAPENAKTEILADQRANRIILHAPKQKRVKMRALIAELDNPIENSGATEVVYLRYASATSLLPILESVAQMAPSAIEGSSSSSAEASTPSPTGNVSNKTRTASTKSTSNSFVSDGSIALQADEDTNAIIITAPPEVIANVKSVIKKLDIRRAQVLIEAVIVEMTSSDATKLGVDWLVKDANGIGTISLTDRLPTLLSAAAGNTTAQASAITTGVTAGLGKTWGAGQYGLGAIISALTSTGNANILSTPSVLTLDNEEAKIMVGQEVPFITRSEIVTAGTNPFQTIERKDVGLTLKVKPQINEGSSIKLSIEQEVSNILPTAGASDLITSKRELKTTVMVDDNSMVVLGGLMDDSSRVANNKVPGLGDVPLIGWAFRYNTNDREKRNLLIFIRPRILKESALAENLSNQKYSELRAQQIEYFGDEKAPGILKALVPANPASQPVMESQASTPAPASTPVSQRITKDATTAGHQWNPDLEAYFND